MRSLPKFFMFRRAIAPVALSLATFGVSAAANSSEQWKPFRWGAIMHGANLVRKGAIILPVRIDGMNCEMQLDTGTGWSSLYRDALPSRYSEFLTAEKLSVERFTLGETRSMEFRLLFDRRKISSSVCGAQDGTRLVGTIGNDILADGNISIDLAGGQFKFRKGSLIIRPEARQASVDFNFYASEAHGKFPVVSIAMADGTKLAMGIDTGSASASLVLMSRKAWLALVGLKDISGVTPQMVHRWGQMVPCYSARVDGAVHLGSFKIPAHAQAVYCDDPRADANIAPPFDGFLGLAPFTDHVLTLDYVSQKVIIEPSIKRIKGKKSD